MGMPANSFSIKTVNNQVFTMIGKIMHLIRNHEAHNQPSESILPINPDMGDLFQLPRPDGKSYCVRIIKNPGRLLAAENGTKAAVVSRMHEFTDVAMAKGPDGVSFSRKKIDQFIPDDGWFAEIWDVTEGRFVGFASVSRKRSRLTIEDVEKVIFAEGSETEKHLYSTGALISPYDLNRLKSGLPFVSYFIESAMIDPRYQGNYFTTSVTELMMLKALLANQDTPKERQANLRLSSREGQNGGIENVSDHIHVATMAATIRTCVAMRPFLHLYPNALSPHSIDWFERAKRYVLSDKKLLAGGFIHKNRYRPGLNYPLDSSGKAILPEKERNFGKGGVWCKFLTQNGYNPSTDAVFLTGWISFQGTNRVSKYVVRKLAATYLIKRMLLLREQIRSKKYFILKKMK